MLHKTCHYRLFLAPPPPKNSDRRAAADELGSAQTSSWTLTADPESRIQAFGNKCYRRMLGISYREHKANEYVWQQDLRSFCCQPSTFASYHGSDTSVAMIRCQRSYYRAPWTEGVAEVPRKSWKDNTKEWTGQLQLTGVDGRPQQRHLSG